MERIFYAIVLIGALYGFALWVHDIFRLVRGLVGRLK